MDYHLWNAICARNERTFDGSPIYDRVWDDEEKEYIHKTVAYSSYEKITSANYREQLGIHFEQIAMYYDLDLDNFYQVHRAELILTGFQAITNTEGFFSGCQWNIPWLEYEDLNEFAIEAQRDHPDAIELLCVYCGRMVRKVVYSFKWAFNGPFSMMDLYQSGMIGVLKAIPMWDEDMGVDFMGYARKWVYNEIQNLLSKDSHLVKIPETWEKLRRQLPHFRAELEAELGERATAEELAFWMFQYGKSKKLIPAPQIAFLETFNVSSSNVVISDDEGAEIEAQDLFEAETRDPADIIANQELVAILLDSLSEEEVEIVTNAKEGMGKLSFKQIAEEVIEPSPITGKPVTPETVRNRFLTAIEKMKIAAINHGVDRELVLDRLYG